MTSPGDDGSAGGAAVVVRALGERALMVDVVVDVAVDVVVDGARPGRPRDLADRDAGLRDRVLAVADALRAAAIPGVTDIVPALRSVLVVLAEDGPRPAATLNTVARAANLAAEVRARPSGDRPRVPPGPEPVVTVPVVYDGTDLEDVAAWAGLSVPEVIARHTAREYVAAFVGFSPGFAYLTAVDPSIAAPRLATPRTRVPAGSVALAGDLTAVYPEASPGGWRLLGRTTVRPFDVDRDPPALLTPGTRVRFLPVRAVEAIPAPRRPSSSIGAPSDTAPAGIMPLPATRTSQGAQHGQACIEVLTSGPLALVEDLGRRGLAQIGVGRSGAADRGALRLANRLLANPDDAAAIEVTMGGLELRFGDDRLFVLTGAPCPAWLADVPVGDRFVLRARPGDVLRLGAPRAGLRTYVGVRGGIAIDPVLGSRSTDTLARIGPAPLIAGTRLPLGTPPPAVPVVEGAPVIDGVREARSRVRPGALEPDAGRWGAAVLTVVPGIRSDWFFEDALEVLAASVYSVHPDSDRVAARLAGAAIPRRARGEYASEGLVRGAVQIPPDGRPVVFLADHPATGGYPVLGVVSPPDVDRLSQRRPGEHVRFAVAREGSP